MKRKIYQFLVPCLIAVFGVGCGMQGPLYETPEEPQTTKKAPEKQDS